MKLIADRYCIVSVLACHFARSTVKVIDQKTGKFYIAKILDRTKASVILIHQFKTEIYVLSMLNDPHVPQLIDVLETQDQLVLVETWIDGQSLQNWMKSFSLYRMWYRKRWILELMLLLENLHSLGFLYIDLKPENILIHNHHLFLLDFNACLPAGSFQTYMATRSNMAPECTRPERKEVFTDIYALGKMVRPLYGFSLYRLWVQKCIRLDTVHRFSSVRKARFWFRIIGYIQKGFLATLLFLSVFSWQRISDFQEPVDPIQQFKEELAQKEGSLQEKVQQLLHEWILEQKLEPEDLVESETASFFLEQGILSRNQPILTFLLESIPRPIQDEKALLVQLAQWIVHNETIWTPSLIKNSLDQIQAEPNTLNKAIHIFVWEQLLLEKEIILDQKERMQLSQIQMSWSLNQIKENEDLFLSVACTHMEYLLFLRTKSISDQEIPSHFLKIFSTKDPFSKLFELYR